MLTWYGIMKWYSGMPLAIPRKFQLVSIISKSDLLWRASLTQQLLGPLDQRKLLGRQRLVATDRLSSRFILV